MKRIQKVNFGHYWSQAIQPPVIAMLFFQCFILLSSPLWGQIEQQPPKPPAEGLSENSPKNSVAGGEVAPNAEPDNAAQDTAATVVRKVFSKEEIASICKKYRDQLISYYNEIYMIEDCQRRPLLSNRSVYRRLSKGEKITQVSGDVIAALPEGAPLDVKTDQENARTCRQLNGRYVSYSNVDIYFIEKCKKRKFPDWNSYLKHRELRGNTKGEILSLSWLEFTRLADGKDYQSVMDDLFAEQYDDDLDSDILPIDEACVGLNGKIEACHKTAIANPEEFLWKKRLTARKIVELSTSQWLSLPDTVPAKKKSELGVAH
jgi:hypothetical protein